MEAVMSVMLLVVKKIEVQLNSILFHSSRMEQPLKQRSKKDKAKEKYDRNGGFSSKHVRIAQELAEKRSVGKTK